MSELLNYLLQNEESFRNRTRLPALYSDFRQQATLNPDGFQANVHAWKRGLSNAALAGHVPSKTATRSHLVLDLDDAILDSLTSPQYGRPLALGSVLNEAVGTGEMLPLQQFLKAQQSIYQKSWGSIPLNVLSWGLRQVGVLGAPGTGRGSDKIPHGQFVLLPNLESASKAFVDATRGRTSPFERTFSKAQFRRTFGNAVLGHSEQLSDADMEVLIRHLTRDKPVLATDGTTIKIRSDSGASENEGRITEEDSAIASLKDLIEDLTRQTEILGRRVEELSAAAQDAVRRKNRVSALAALKSKKLAETNLEKRHATLYQLEEVATKISQAADNVAMVRVMQSSTSALRSLNSQVGGADKVDEVLDSLREQMGQVDEVGNVIADTAGVYSAATVDEAEVDDEFEAMLAEERRKEEAAQRVKDDAVRKDAEDTAAEETRRKLAELERLGPVPTQQPDAGKEAEKRPTTPGTATAEELEKLNVGHTSAEQPRKEPVRLPAE
ncbi:Snf7-domain-containing protein [Microdochium trichocladiopsis]|uniref:Snf7-domain-containing protein n=1 Tax=Microdochium trichocladiopsis TaxID=1682393 RepID=A0A9P9BTS8_9PEZI|nr:Snf7-domain-containing protein [Microdochium trichocladiopsis]KAH7035792.1 Snf7-domain-containing protein [Microdochium trichocladiopsis]